ncbi:MAG: beta-N-acetylhexosaminidase [Rhodobacteraceae bacterium]|nr:beta-N-acetylhexosaminidase [Paracoccaceae bacterium]
MYPGDRAVSSAGAVIFGCEGVKLTQREKDFFRDTNPFGFILFARNIESGDQIRALCDELRDCVGHEAPILIDQEGGRVQRLRPPLARQWAPPLEFVAQAGDAAERAMYLRYRLMAEELRSYGIDANCAPLVDVAEEGTHPFLKDRCYGVEAETVARLGRAVADGLIEGGVYPVLKHIPGHGRARADSHLDLPRVAAGREALARDFAPFAALNDLAMGMTAHLVYEAIDDQPATISPKMMGLIRDEIGFGGLIMTDDISMQALSGTLAERSRASIAAGCDVILHCNGDYDEMVVVAEAAGALQGRAKERAEAVHGARPSPMPVDIPALSAELEALLSGQGYV